MENITLSIFVPCLNEERNINDALSNIKEGVQDINYEILVTDDASKDKTIEVIEKFKNAYGDYLDAMSGFILIKVNNATLILSPAYDLGLTENELRETHMSKLNNIYPDQLS